MATVDRIVSHNETAREFQNDVFKTLVADSFGKVGSDNYGSAKKFDPSKLRLLKAKMQKKKIHSMMVKSQLSITVCDHIHIESNNSNIKVKKKRRKRRKKKKLSIVNSVFEIEIMDGTFIPSSIPVLEIECNAGISMASSLSNRDSYCDLANHYQNGNLSFVASIGGRIVSDSGNDEDDDDNSAEQDYKLGLPADVIHFGSCSSDSNNGNSPHAVSNGGGGVVDQDNEAHSAASGDDNDSTGQEYQRHQQADFELITHRQDDLELKTYQQADLDSSFGAYNVLSNLTVADIADGKNQFDPCIELSQVIQNHNGVSFNGKETIFVSLVTILNDIYNYGKKFGYNMGIDKSSLQYLQVLLIDDLNSMTFRQLQMDFNCDSNNNGFYSLSYLFLDLMHQCIQYDYQVYCDRQSLQNLQFLFVDNPSSLNSLNGNKNKNINNNNNNNSTTRNNGNNKNNSSSRHNNNNGRHFQYSRRRGRKKRQYKMVYKNKLQNVKCKQFGNDDNYISSCHNSVVQTKLVTARAPRCAPINEE